MLVELTNAPRPYSWGDRESLSTWQRRPTAEQPEAELWLGTHPGSEASVVTPSGGEQLLSRFLAEQDLSPELPFLDKVLAAAKPLSIQVHPTQQQARRGFASEELAGINLSSPQRNYKDTSDKPEVMVAWSGQFEALVGFQDRQGMEGTLRAMGSLLGASGPTRPLWEALDQGVDSVIEWLVTRESESAELAQVITEAFAHRAGASGTEPVWQTWASVIPHYPGDPGIVVSSFLNLITLRKGEALFVPAGIAHAYIQGFGLEVMAPSDNVVRGGLTDKHVDRPQLARLVVRDSYTSARLTPRIAEDTADEFEVPGVPFSIRRVAGERVTLGLASPLPIVIVVHEGTSEVLWDESTESLEAGRAYLWAPKHETTCTMEVTGTVYLVSPG